jgi:hypothetical protein
LPDKPLTVGSKPLGSQQEMQQKDPATISQIIKEAFSK